MAALAKGLREFHGSAWPLRQAGTLGVYHGGLYMNAWARLRPDRVSVLYLDNGVCDIRSWRGGFALSRRERGSAKGRAMYEPRSATRTTGRGEAKVLPPAESLLPAIKSGVSSSHATAPPTRPSTLRRQCGACVKLWQDNGGRVKLFPKEGGDHHPHGLPDSAPLIEVLVAEAE
jgi:hypothetical protein